MDIISKGLNEIKYLLGLQPVRDALWNFGAYFIIILVGIVTSSMLAKNISPEEYGMLGLITTIIGMVAGFIGFGFFEGYSLVLLKEEAEEKQKELIGTGILILAGLSVIFFIVTLILVPLIHLIYNNILITQALLIINFVSCFSLINIFIINTTKYLGKMKWQAFYSLLQPILYLIGIILLLKYEILTFQYSLIVIYITFLLGGLLMIIYLKPSFSNIKENFRKIRKMQKTEGWHSYVGQSFERATFSLDNIILGLFNTANIAFYTLGNMLVSPISMFSTKLTDSFIKHLNKRKKIPKRIFLYNFIWWLLCSTILLLIAKYIILYLWSNEYLIILDFLWLILIAILVSNFYYIFFIFLHMKGKNKNIKIYFYIRGIANLTGNILLIPIFGIEGAIFATIIGNLLFLTGEVYEYNKINL